MIAIWVLGFMVVLSFVGMFALRVVIARDTGGSVINTIAWFLYMAGTFLLLIAFCLACYRGFVGCSPTKPPCPVSRPCR